MKHLDLATMPKKKKILLLAAAIVAIVAICALVIWLCMPLIDMLNDPEKQQAFESWVESLGVWGVLVMLFIQVLQIVVAVIPGEVVQVMAGVMYGTLGGLVLCLVGCVLASAAVFLLIRKCGRDFVIRFFGEDMLDKYSFLQDTSRLETIVFVLFLIPGLPKDALTYIVPLSRIRLVNFLTLSTLGRIPGMVASTLIGSSITSANWLLIIIVFAVCIAFGLLGIWKKDAMVNWAKRKSGSKSGAKGEGSTETNG